VKEREILLFRWGVGYFDTIEKAKQARKTKANSVFGAFTNAIELN